MRFDPVYTYKLINVLVRHRMILFLNKQTHYCISIMEQNIGFNFRKHGNVLHISSYFNSWLFLMCTVLCHVKRHFFFPQFVRQRIPQDENKQPRQHSHHHCHLRFSRLVSRKYSIALVCRLSQAAEKCSLYREQELTLKKKLGINFDLTPFEYRKSNLCFHGTCLVHSYSSYK